MFKQQLNMNRFHIFSINVLFRNIILIFVASTLLWMIVCELNLKFNTTKNNHYVVDVENTLLNYLITRNITGINNITQETESKIRICDNHFYSSENYDSEMENETVTEGVKTILFWTRSNYDPLYYFKEKGQNGFIKHKCKVRNCYVTDDRNLFGENITKFDAIVFNGQAFKEKSAIDDLPKVRLENQKYIFYEIQSASDHVLCSGKLDGYFNWTMTYRLDSDIPCPFILVKNKTGHIVGPKQGMVWKTDASFRSEYNPDIESKRKLAAWFPFDCTRLNAPSIFAYMLKESLTEYKLGIDTYGNCGPLVCVKSNKECEYINRHYFFLLTLENSEDKDYVTEKVLVALRNNVVPVVFGGADYSRFLPPGSYIDGSILTSENIALCMVSAMTNHKIYQTYFIWKEYYSFHKSDPVESLCSLCAELNNEAKTKQRNVYKHFRRWWNPDYTEKCVNNTKTSVRNDETPPFRRPKTLG